MILVCTRRGTTRWFLPPSESPDLPVYLSGPRASRTHQSDCAFRLKEFCIESWLGELTEIGGARTVTQ